MVKRLTKDKDAELNGYIQEMIDSGIDESEIQSFTNEFVSQYGIDDAMPEKKNEVQGLNVEVGTSVGSSVKSPVSSIKTEQNVGLSPSGKKGIDILRGASVKPISPTKTAIPQTPKKKKSKVEELRKSIQQKVAVGEPLTTDEVSEVRDISSNAFLPLDGLKDGEVNAVLAGAQNKQNQQLISKSRNDQYQKQLKDRIVSGEVLPEDIKGMYDVSGFAPPDTDFEKLANDWNAENIKIKQKIDSELLNESTKVDKYIVDLDDKIRNLERQAVETRRTSTNEMDIEAQSATDGAIRNLKSIKYKAQEYLDYLSEKAIDTSKDEIIKRVNKIQGVRDEKGLVKDVVSLEQVVDDYISTQPTEKQNLLLRKKPYLVESLVASEYVIPKANEVFYQKAESIISDVPQSAKQLFKRVTGEIDVKDGEEKYYDTQQQFAIANNAASLYFMDEVVRTNQAFESVVSLPNVRNAVGGKLDVLKQQYDAGQISASDYKLKRLQALSLNPQTSEYVKEYVRKIQNAQERYESKIDKFLQSKVPDFAKFTEVDESGNIVSIAGMKPMEFTQKMTELQTAKTESLNEAASMYKTDIENRAVERRGELFGRGIKSWVGASFAKGTYGLFESMGRWAYDNTGLEFFDASRRGATDMLYNASVPFESQEVQDIMDIEAGDYAKAFNPLYITGVASESAPYMLATIAAGIASGGLAEGVLLGMGLSEGIGAAITLSRAGRVAQKTIAAISSGTSDAYLNMTANYNDLIKEGYSKEQAKQIAFDAFKNELPVDILSGAVEMDALFRATSKPTIKNIIKGGANKAGSILIEEPIQEVYQGYSLEKAKGTSKSLVDYAFFDKEGFNNLVGGFAGGLGTSAVTNAMGIAKNALSWNRLYNVSTADMQNAVRYAGVAQMVATPSEMQNSINLDLLKSAQSISQEEYQKIPNNERAQKEKAKNEYVNRTVAYVYGKSINNSVQNGLNIEDVHEHYKAHNEAISKAYSTLAELANETNKPMYKKQADYYASLAQKSEIGQQTPIYSLITPKGRVFISEQTAKTLGEGSIQQKNDSFAKAVRAGDIIGVQVVDDSQTAQSLIKKFDDAKLSQQLAVQQSQGGATEVGQPNQTNVQTPIEGTTEIPTTKGVIDKPNISPESTTSTAQEQVEVSGLGTETIGGEVAAQPEQQPIFITASGTIITGGGTWYEYKGKNYFITKDGRSIYSEDGLLRVSEFAEIVIKDGTKIEQPISTTQSGSNPALRDVESVAKALRENEEKGGKPIPTTLIPKQEFEVLNNGNRGLNDIIAETYHKAKAKPENTRTEQEQELIKAVESALTGEAEKILEQQPISTTQSEIEKKTKEISDLEERLKEPLLRPVIFEDDYSPSQLRDLKETWAKQDEEERIIIRKEIAQKQAELKELEQQPILGVQPQADNTALDEFFERVARFVVTSDIEIKPITLVKQFNLGYNRATKIINQLEAAGIVEANTDDKPRKLMIQSEAELDSILENIKKPTTQSGSNPALSDVESTAKADYLVDSFFIEKINPDGENTPLTERQQGSIDKAIQMAIDAGQTAEQIAGTLNGLGYAFRNPLGMRATQQTLINYIKNRIKGIDTRNVNEFAKDTQAVDSLLSKEQPISTTQSGSNPALRDVESTAKALEGKDIDDIIKPKNTRIVDEKGNPLKLYHVSENIIKGDIRTVNNNVLSWHEKRPENEKKLYQTDKDGNYTEIGFHLGGEGTVKDFAERYGITPKTKLSVFLDINNPVEIKDLAAWTPTNIIKELDNMGYDVGKLKDKYTASEALEILKNLGIDGFKYENIYEYSGEKYSYMAIHPEQVIIIDNNKVAEAYHKAKADGSNPELVKAVESILSKEQPISTTQSGSSADEIERRRPTDYIRDSKDKKSSLETFRNEAKREWDGVSVITGDRMKNLYVGIQLFVEAYPEYKELLNKFIKKENGTIGITNNNLSFVLNTLKKQGVTTESELGSKINAKYDAELKAVEQQPTSTTQSGSNPALSDVESTVKALEGLSDSQMLEIPYTSGVDRGNRKDVAEAYHAAKSNPENTRSKQEKQLVEAVESLLSKEQQPIEIDESTPFDLSIALQTKKEEQDAIQKQSTTEEVLLNERPEMGLQEVGEGNAQVEAVAEQGSQEEKIEVAPLSFTPKNFIEELIGVEGAVALSGINEQQRQELIKDRLRTTTLTPQKEKEREIVKLVKSHNGMRRNARERLDVRGRIMRLVNDYNKEYPNQKLTFKSWYGDVKVTRPSFDRKQKSTYQKDLTVANLDVSNASLDETEKTFSERSDEFQRKFIELMDLGVQFEFRDAGNKKFSQKMLDDAMNDLENGIPSRRAAVILNTVEKAIEENVITVGGSLTEGFQYIPLNLAIEETKEMKYEDELRNLSNAEIVAIYENEILAQKELDNIIQQEYEREFESDPNDEFGNVRQLAPRKKRDIINPNQEGDNQGQTSEGTIEKNQNVENETPKTTANREAGENLVGGNQADIPTNADGNGQREEEITENTPKQGEEGVGVVTGAPTPVISEMDRAVLDAMKPTFEIEFIPNAKFLNTSAPLENKSSQDAIKRRYQTIKKLLECL